MVLRAKMKENLLHYTEGDEKEQHKEVPEEEKELPTKVEQQVEEVVKPKRPIPILK